MTKPSKYRADEGQRFFEKVAFGRHCWTWTGAKHKSGHGSFRLGPGETDAAHRIIYRWLVGPIPPGFHIDHLCRNTSCVNPGHLQPVTRGENLRRALSARTHCKKGHPYSGGNLMRRVNPRTKSLERVCRECHRAAMVAINAKWNAFYREQRRAAKD